MEYKRLTPPYLKNKNMTLDKKECCEKCGLGKAFCQCGWVGKTDENCHQSPDNSMEWEERFNKDFEKKNKVLFP